MLDTNFEMAGDWKLTYGSVIGLATDNHPAHHFIPVNPGFTYVVHFQRDISTPDGARYKGFYKPENPPHNPNLHTLGALMAETFYANRGVYVVQLREHIEQYFAVLSGYHQVYPTDPTYVQIVGGWADVGPAAAPTDPTLHTDSVKGNFTLVKV